MITKQNCQNFDWSGLDEQQRIHLRKLFRFDSLAIIDA